MSSKKIRPIQGKVVRAVQETPEAWTLEIEVAPQDKEYTAGQFLSISPHQFPELSELIAYLEYKKGRKELIRAYSIASAPYEPYVAITTKPERFYPEETLYPPLLSPLLASNALLGRPLEFLGYTGAYVLDPAHGEHTDEVLHWVAGSGAVPNFALLKDELTQNKNPHVVHTLIDVNKSFEDIIYQKQFDDLAARYPNRFKLIHFLTREEDPKRHGDNYFAGRPTLEQVRSYVKDPASVLVYSCGAAVTKWQKQKAKEQGVEPKPRFLESVGEIVTALGVDRKRFKREIYG